MAVKAENKTPETPAENPAMSDPFAALENPQEFEGASLAEIPEKIHKYVENLYALWQQKPRKWYSVNLGSKAEVRRITRLAKAAAAQKGLVFRVNTQTPEHILGARVTPQPPAKTEPAPETAESESGA